MKSIFLILTYFIELVTTCYALLIFISYFKWCPTYEGSGMQFVINQTLITPVMGMIGITYFLFFRSMNIPMINYMMPWLVIVLALINPLFFTLNTIRVSIGSVLLIFLICVSFWFKLKHVLHCS